MHYYIILLLTTIIAILFIRTVVISIVITVFAIIVVIPPQKIFLFSLRHGDPGGLCPGSGEAANRGSKSSFSPMARSVPPWNPNGFRA